MWVKLFTDRFPGNNPGKVSVHRKYGKTVKYQREMDILYRRTGFDIARIITRNYSTSFFSAVNLLSKEIQEAVFGIYGFVRLADEIVDSFGEYDRAVLFDRFEEECRAAAVHGISVNPVINAYESTVRHYRIDRSLTEAFLKSMRMDLTKKVYVCQKEADDYIYGSAAAVGLMCLRVFTDKDDLLYERLKAPATKLGSAFQKVNFLRDLRTDLKDLGRSYFPGVDTMNFSEASKQRIIAEIETEFAEAYEGIRQLPRNSRLGVYMAYIYYTTLLQKIKRTPVRRLINHRIRVADFSKALLFSKSLLMNKINRI